MTLRRADYDPRMGVFDKTRDVVRGQRVVIPLNLAAGASEGPISLQPITILDQQLPFPGAWDINLSPITFAAGAQVWPITPSLQPTNLLPSAGGYNIQFNLHYGAGGTSFHTVGYWPAMGTCFTLATDVIRLDVQCTNNTGTIQRGGEPVLSAWATPAQSNKPLLTEAFNVALPTANIFPVPLGAKFMYASTNSSVACQIAFGKISGGPAGQQYKIDQPGSAVVQTKIAVPGDARIWTVTAGDSTASIIFECELG